MVFKSNYMTIKQPTATELREMAEKLLEKDEGMESKDWPKKGDEYWVVSSYGDIQVYIWEGIALNEDQQKQGIFPTAEGARMKALRQESLEVPNRVYKHDVKLYWLWNFVDAGVQSTSVPPIDYVSEAFFLTEEEAQEWFNKYGEAWLYPFENNK